MQSGICDKGGYCDGVAFTACGAGTYNPYNGSTSIADCIPCPPGGKDVNYIDIPVTKLWIYLDRLEVFNEYGYIWYLNCTS